MVRGVVFDFGNVIYRFDYRIMARALAGERAPELWRGFVGTPLQHAYETGACTLEEVLSGLAKLGFPVGRERFLEAYLSIFSPLPGMRALLESLAGRFTLGLLSNTSPEHARLFIEQTPEFRLFGAAAYSFEVGCMKPAPETYLEICHKLGLAPRSLAYTDDVTEFALAAGRVGMVGLPFRGVADLTGELVRLGVSAPPATDG